MCKRSGLWEPRRFMIIFVTIAQFEILQTIYDGDENYLK